MNDWLLAYIIGVILFFILSLIIELKEEYEDVNPHTLKYVNWLSFNNWLLDCFFFRLCIVFCRFIFSGIAFMRNYNNTKKIDL